MERKAYEVVVEDEKLIYKQTGELLNTTEDVKWIFVLSTSRVLYVGKKKKGTFQHYSFLAGGVTVATGRNEIGFGFDCGEWDKIPVGPPALMVSPQGVAAGMVLLRDAKYKVKTEEMMKSRSGMEEPAKLNPLADYWRQHGKGFVFELQQTELKRKP